MKKFLLPLPKINKITVGALEITGVTPGEATADVLHY
jgi:hypothetical protein